MNDPVGTEPLYHDEGLCDVMIRNRPSLTHIWPEVLEDLAPNSVVNVCGSSGSGKSMFIMELISRIIMRDDLNGSEAFFVDSARKFNVFKLIEICTKMLDEESRGSADCVQNCIKPKMKKVQILSVEEFNESLFSNIEFYLRENPQISLICIDSLEEFIEVDFDTISISKKNEVIQNPSRGVPLAVTSSDQVNIFEDLSRHLERLKRIANKFQVCIVVTTPTYVDIREEIADVKVELTKIRDEAFCMKINNSKEVPFTIGFYGIQIAEPPSF